MQIDRWENVLISEWNVFCIINSSVGFDMYIGTEDVLV